MTDTPICKVICRDCRNVIRVWWFPPHYFDQRLWKCKKAAKKMRCTDGKVLDEESCSWKNRNGDCPDFEPR